MLKFLDDPTTILKTDKFIYWQIFKSCKLSYFTKKLNFNEKNRKRTNCFVLEKTAKV